MRAVKNETERMTITNFIRAIDRRRPITITYIDVKNDETVRTIEPYKVDVSDPGNIIVTAMCRKRGELRTFRLDRITHYTIHRGSFHLEDKQEDPEQPTDWWAFTSRSGHEISRLEIKIPSSVLAHQRYPYVMSQATAQSGRIRAVVKAEHGIGMRRLLRREVSARK